MAVILWENMKITFALTYAGLVFGKKTTNEIYIDKDVSFFVVVFLKLKCKLDYILNPL